MSLGPWNGISLAPGETYIISKDKHLEITLIPEPAAPLLLLLGLLVGFWRPYRNSSKNRQTERA